MATSRQLTVDLADTEAIIGRPLTIRVRDSSCRPVEGAIVSTATGSKTARTNADGYCQLTFHSPGFWQLFVTRESDERHTYRPTTTVVRAITAGAATQRTRRAIASQA
ncbi:hypothetical protein [Natrialba sp. SSL1]|uniref:hypothetical protein n=1 Tax=Natrialba sp. SSL1 TaxID=1869245 RepID=UPI0008F95876|nr:hypothetical protein [Natrialba sp. SSL1]OIB56463.1 hypothetical protein BBD46_17695 [Natrialba sp. SSL1]